jgi:hypothetical protein
VIYIERTKGPKRVKFLKSGEEVQEDKKVDREIRRLLAALQQKSVDRKEVAA